MIIDSAYTGGRSSPWVPPKSKPTMALAAQERLAVSLADTQKVWIGALVGLASKPAGDRHVTAGGNMATKSNAQAWCKIFDGPTP